MPYRRKDSPVWWVSYTDPSGQRVRRSTETTDRKEAVALEAKWNLEAHQVRQWGVKQSRTFDELMLVYLRGASDKRSAYDDRGRARRLKEWFTGRNMHEQTGVDVRHYIEKRKQDGVSNSTINRELALLSAAINYANREWEWGLPNVAQGRQLKEPQGRLRYLSRSEAQALIRAASESDKRAAHLADFIRLALNTGCRYGELMGLEWRRVDFGAGLILLEPEHTKTGRRRSVPLNQEARAALLSRARFRAEHCPDSPWVFCDKQGKHIQHIRRGFTTACKQAGIEDFHIHDLRHTCAAWLVSAKVPLSEVRDLLGHHSVTMTERYAHLSPENVRAAVAVLDGSVSQFGHANDEALNSKQVSL